MRKKHPKADMYLADRQAGMTYQQIADKYGVSKQAVGQVCSKSNPQNFRFITESVVYPNLRKWMNDNKVSRSEFARLLGMIPYASVMVKFGLQLSGNREIEKSMIDKMIEVTGMTYEELFYKDDK